MAESGFAIASNKQRKWESGSMQKVLIAGATGVTGTALVWHFADLPDWEVVSTARRDPWFPVSDVRHVCVDLTSAAACMDAFRDLDDVTHIIYAAVNEDEADIVRGWDNEVQAEKNVGMLRNLLEPFTGFSSRSFRHITLIHGMKAYGSHLPQSSNRLPYKESDETYAQLNFYHHQQAYVAAQAQGATWDWTVLRPNGTIGIAVGGNLNWSLVLATYAALCAEAGEALQTPLGNSALIEITDSALIAQACEWAAVTPIARNEVYNITNGDIFAMHDVFPLLARAFGLQLAAPRAFSLTDEIKRLAPLWPTLVRKHQLRAPDDLGILLGATPQIVGAWSKEMPPERLLLSGISSTIKLRQAGFSACADSVDTVGKYIARYRELAILP